MAPLFGTVVGQILWRAPARMPGSRRSRPFAGRTMRPVDEPRLYPNVELGEGAVLEPGVVVGLPPRGAGPGELPTRIGYRFNEGKDGELVKVRVCKREGCGQEIDK